MAQNNQDLGVDYPDDYDQELLELDENREMSYGEEEEYVDNQEGED